MKINKNLLKNILNSNSLNTALILEFQNETSISGNETKHNEEFELIKSMYPLASVFQKDFRELSKDPIQSYDLIIAGFEDRFSTLFQIGEISRFLKFGGILIYDFKNIDVEYVIKVCEYFGISDVGQGNSTQSQNLFYGICKKETFFNNDNSKVAAKIYDNMASKYDEIASGEHYKVPSWFALNLQQSRLVDSAILDLGCATGNFGKILNKLNVKHRLLFGMDVSEEMVSRCRNLNIYDSVLCFDLSKEISTHNYFQFDLIIAFGVLEFIEQINELFHSVHSLMNDNALFYFTLDYSQDIKENSFNTQSGVFKKYSYSQDMALALIKNNGFQPVSIEIGPGYVSPSTGESVDYIYCIVKK